jgi:hypothetical protein
MDRDLVSFDERPLWVEDPDELATAEHTSWVVDPKDPRRRLVSRGRATDSPVSIERSVTARSPRGTGPHTGPRTGPRAGSLNTGSRGSNVASLIPRPALRSMPPETVAPPPRPAPISAGTVRIVAASAGVSLLALVGTAALCGAVVVAALMTRPSPPAPSVAAPVLPLAAAPADREAGAPVLVQNTDSARRARGGAGQPPAGQASVEQTPTVSAVPVPEVVVSAVAVPEVAVPATSRQDVPPPQGPVAVAGLPTSRERAAARASGTQAPLSVLEAARPAPAPAAEPAPAPAGDSWLDGLSSLVSGLTESEPARPPSLAATLPPAAPPVPELQVDDGLDDLAPSRPPPAATADDAALALLASLEDKTVAPAPARTPTAAVPNAIPAAPTQVAPPVSDGSWLDAVVALGNDLVETVTGPSEPLVPPLSLTELEPTPASLPRPGTPSRPSLAETLGAPVVAEVDQRPLELEDGLGALTDDLAREGRGEPPAGPDPTVAAMLAELDEPVQRVPVTTAPASSAPATAAARSTPAQPLPAQPPPAQPTLAQPAIEDEGGWLDAVVSVGDGLRTLVTDTLGAPEEPPVLPPLGSPRLNEPPSLATTLAPTAAPAAPAEPVDLLADDDGLVDLQTARVDRTGGFGSASGSEDAALALLAEVEASTPKAPAPAAPVVAASEDSWLDDVVSLGTDVASRVMGAPEPKMVPGTSPSQADPMDSLVADLASERPSSLSSSGPPSLAAVMAPAPAGTSTALPSPPPPSAPARVAAAEEEGWLASMVSVGTSIATGMGLGTAEPEGLSPTLPPIDPMRPLSNPGQASTASRTASRPAEVTLELDDGLGDLGTVSSSSGWQDKAGDSDPAMAMLAELDRPSAPAARPAPAQPPAPVVEEDSWLDTLTAVGSSIASMVTGSSETGLEPTSAPSLASTLPPPSRATAPSLTAVRGTPDERPAAPPERMAPLGSPPAGTSGPVVARAPAPPNSSPPTPTFQTPVAPRPAPEKPVCEGEFCDDLSVLDWKDPIAEEVDLLADDNLDFSFEGSSSVAELFYTPSEEDKVSGLEGLASEGLEQSLPLVPVAIKTSVPGVAVDLDGKTLGRTPLLTEVTPGPHLLRLVTTFGGVTTYQLTASDTTSEWCFEARGRTFRYVRCD